jgi:hypothetical protein
MHVKEAAKNLLNRKEITQEEYNFIEKNAFDLSKINWTEALKALQGIAIGTAALSGAAYGGEELYHKLKQHVDINNAFKTMNEKVPALNEYPQEKIQDYFDVIKSFSPHAASNPLVAGALVHKMLEFGGVDHKLVQDISRISKEAPSGFLYDVAKSGVGGFAQLPKPDDKLKEHLKGHEAGRSYGRHDDE